MDDGIADLLPLVLDEILEPVMLAVAAIELADEIQPVLLAVGDLVEDLLHFGGESDVHVVAEVLTQQARHGERREARHERLALTRHVAAPLNRGDGRRIRRRPSDALLLRGA